MQHQYCVPARRPNAIKRKNVILSPPEASVLLSHLVIESTLLVQKLYKLRVGLTPPEVEITDLKVTPD